MNYQFFDTSNEISTNQHLTNIDHVSIEFSGNFKTPYTFLYFADQSILAPFAITQSLTIPLILFNENILIIETNTMREQKNCKNREQGIFSDTLKDQMIIDCFNYETNQTYSCLPIHKTWSLIRWERDLNYFKYTICPMNTTINYDLFYKIIYSCIGKYPVLCEKDIFSVHNNYRSN